MSRPRKGIRVPLSPARKVVMELLHHARKVPTLPLSRELDVGELVPVRAAARVSWLAIFLRAYGLVARRHAELRRALIPWPYKHLYEHPVSEAAILVEREWQGEQVVLGGRIYAPENQALADIDRLLRYFRSAPVWEVSSFRQLLRLGKLPGLLRRFTFWHTLYLSGATRAKRFGTFMISSLGNLGVEQHHPLTPLTTYFTFGPIAASGAVTAKIIYDHRVLDGRTVARCLQELDHVLHGELLYELREAADAISSRKDSRAPELHSTDILKRVDGALRGN
jgi:hypothetical protein